MPDKRAIDTMVRVLSTDDIRPGDADIIQKGMLGYPPSSKTYQQLAEALKKAKSRNVEGSSVPEGQPLGLPTADFMLGTGVNMDWASGLGSAVGGWTGEESGGTGLPSVKSQAPNSRGFHISSQPKETKVTPTGTPVTNPDEGDPMVDVFNNNAPAGLPQFPGGMGAAANDVSAMSINPPGNYDWKADLDEMSEGYSFSGMAPGNLGMLLSDPAVHAKLVAEQRGGGDATAAMDQQWMEAANQLAAMGVIGGSVDNTVFGGNWDQPSRLAAMEDVSNLMAQPGMQFVNPRDIYGESFRRAEATDYSTLKGQNGEPIGIDEVIQITNGALQAQAPFMTPEAAAYLSSRLSGAAVEYKAQLAKGETSLSYPAFLKAMGADTWQV